MPLLPCLPDPWGAVLMHVCKPVFSLLAKLMGHVISLSRCI